MKPLSIAVIGCGAFAKHFVPLFQAHPAVEKVFVCDLDKSRAEDYSAKFGVEIIPSFEEVLKRKDVTAVAIFTQRHTHGPLAIAALNAGKDVYSAVPMASSVEDCEGIIEAVKRSGRVYMMGETCVYYPCSMYCREAYARGEFGNFVYAEAQYHHDLSHFSLDFQADRPHSAVPPFFYPTHSTAMVLNAVGDHVKSVSALGYIDREINTPYAAGENPWNNIFSNEFSMMRLSGGGTARINECRRIGYKAPSSYISAFYGTKGAYQFNHASHYVTSLVAGGVNFKDVSEYVNPMAMTEHRTDETFDFDVANHKYQWCDFSPIQMEEAKRLPQTFLDAPKINGHMASHQFLIDDFCRAASEGTLPYVNAYRAARFTVPGLIAHESAKKDGLPMDVPDFGDGKIQ